MMRRVRGDDAYRPAHPAGKPSRRDNEQALSESWPNPTDDRPTGTFPPKWWCESCQGAPASFSLSSITLQEELGVTDPDPFHVCWECLPDAVRLVKEIERELGNL